MPADDKAMARGPAMTFAWPLRDSQVALAFLAIFLVLQVRLVFTFNINWDEFFFLNQVYSYQHGRLGTAFQTFHVHLFGWLTALPISEPDQIVAGRLVMLLAQAGTAWCIFLIARTLATERQAMLAVLAWLASGYALGHGVSFRADPLAAFLLMAALALLFTNHRSWPYAALAGALAGLALLVTIKSALYAPAFLAALVQALRTDAAPGKAIRLFALAGACFAVVYGVGTYAHGLSIGPAPVATGLQAGASGALEKTVLSQALFPRLVHILRWLILGIVPVALVFVSLAMALKMLLIDRPALAVTFLLLAAPLLSLVVYRNAYPYFFPFILAPAAPVIVLAARLLHRTALRYAFIALMLAGAVLQYARLSERDQSAQRATIAAVHELFPTPVPYVDRSGMIPSFPRVGPLLSTWGIEGMVASGRPVLAPLIEAKQPPVLIVNSPAIEKALSPTYGYAGPRLLPADDEALRSTYVPHWGAIWVAGASLTATGTEQPIRLVIAGRFTLECRGPPVLLDGERLPCGAAVQLAAGSHHLLGAASQAVTLRWGDRLPRPAAPPPSGPVYYGF